MASAAGSESPARVRLAGRRSAFLRKPTTSVRTCCCRSNSNARPVPDTLSARRRASRRCTGKSVWRRRILLDEDTNNDHLTISRLSAGPDLNGDGYGRSVRGVWRDRPTAAECHEESRAGGHTSRITNTSVSRPCPGAGRRPALAGTDAGRTKESAARHVGTRPVAMAAALGERPCSTRDNARRSLRRPELFRVDCRSCDGFRARFASRHGMDRRAGWQGVVFGHVPGSWNPRYTPDQGQLIQWLPSFKPTPAKRARHRRRQQRKLPTPPTFWWQERVVAVGVDALAVVEIAAAVLLLLVVLLLPRRWGSSLVLLALVLLSAAARHTGCCTATPP